jgi:hypothetical protein
VRIFKGQQNVPLASIFRALFHFALDWRFSSGTAMKKAAWNENNSSMFSLAYYFRFNLTNTTCCGYNYLVPPNGVASRFNKTINHSCHFIRAASGVLFQRLGSGLI